MSITNDVELTLEAESNQTEIAESNQIQMQAAQSTGLLLVFLLKLVADINDLQDVVVGRQLQGSNVHLHIFMQEVFRQPTHFFGPCSTPHECLSVRLDIGDILI